MSLKGKHVLVVIAPDKFRDEELLVPKQLLEQEGASVDIASKGVKKSTGMLGVTVDVDMDIEDADLDNYDAVVFVGGSGTAVYFDDEKVLELANSAKDRELVIGAICIAPSILANAGMLEGRKATSYSSEEKNLIDKGCLYSHDDVVVDGKIVTASGPKAAESFGRKLAELLS